MANIFSKIKIPTATEHKTTFDLSCDHVTTMNFFVPKVVYAKETVPKENTVIKVESLTRLSPLLAPTFMRASVKTRAFYVPYRTVWRGWNDFIASTPAPTGSLSTKVPYTTNKDLAVYIKSTLALCTPALPGATSFDFQFEDTSLTPTTYTKYNFTKKGRIFYDILVGLGYRINWTDADTSELSVLPILCYIKAYSDWYYRNQYVSQNYADQIREVMAYGTSYFTGTLLVTMLSRLQILVCQYDNDYFTSAFSKPNGPSTIGPSTQIYNNDPTLARVTTYNTNQSEAIIPAGNSINTFALQALSSLSDYLKRHQLSGSQAVDRLAARFGVKLDNAKLEKSIYLGTDEVKLQIGEVFNQTEDASGSGSPLGSYAGKGLGYGNNGTFNISTDEYGMIILVANIVPRVGYCQGVKRHTMHLNPLDFYTPEFDGLGNQAIAMKEISLPWDKSVANNWLSASSTRNPNDVFGYTPRYAEYKFGQDFMTGNYIYHSTNTGEDCWNGFRLFRDSPFDSLQSGRIVGDVTAGTSMLYANDADQYDRIFADDLTTLTEGNDHFRSIFHFDVKTSAPMSSLYDNYHFEEAGKAYLTELGGSSLHN